MQQREINQAALCYVISRHRETNTVCFYFSVVSNVVRVTKIKSKRTIIRDMIMAKENCKSRRRESHWKEPTVVIYYTV